MANAGIVAEFNPFHSGHAWMIGRCRQLLGEDAGVVCVMSGNFVQRGEPAAFGKHARARAAVLCGADLVVELPLPYALSSAEGFARGAVGILDGLGVVTHLCFGSEAGELGGLNRLAGHLLSEEADGLIKKELEGGTSYAAARQRAAEGLAGEDARLLGAPNNILGIEYLKALKSSGSSIEALTFPRMGAGHDARRADGEMYASASEIRKMLAARELEAAEKYVPRAAFELFLSEMERGLAPAALENGERAVLARLRALRAEDYAALPDASEGLEKRLMRYAKSCVSIGEVCEKTKSKRYAMSRIRRMLLSAYLGVTKESLPTGPPPYIRALAFNRRGRELLRGAASASGLPVLTKPAHAKRLEGPARRTFELEAASTDLYVLFYPELKNAAGGQEWTRGPEIV